MKKRNLIFLIIVIAFSYIAIDFASPFFKDYTKQFLKKYGEVNFDEFKGTSFVVRSMRGKKIHCYGSKHSITNGIIWFDINCDTYEYLSDEPRFTPSEDSLSAAEKSSLLQLKPLFPTFVKYRVRSLSVSKNGDIFIGVADPISNLFKPAEADVIPDELRNELRRKINGWYLLKGN